MLESNRLGNADDAFGMDDGVRGRVPLQKADLLPVRVLRGPVPEPAEEPGGKELPAPGRVLPADGLEVRGD